MTTDDRTPYRDPLDKDEDVHTDLIAADGGVQVAAELARLERDVTVAGKALLDALDALIGNVYIDPMEVAVLVVKLTEHVTARQGEAITRLVVDREVPAREVGKRLGWTPAAVAFACRRRR